MEDQSGIQEQLNELLKLIARLRAPEGGCPWDVKQRSTDAGRYLMEEACELIDALESGPNENIREELGDLLFQVLFLARIKEEEGSFDIGDVIRAVTQKMIRRHPHVFGNVIVSGAEEVKANWEAIKKGEEGRSGKQFLLDKVPRSLPALLKAEKITREASRVGFDWESAPAVLEKVEEEIREFRESLEKGEAKEIKAELGDILFSIVNLSRFLGISADEALRGANRKFLERFRFIEDTLKKQGKSLEEAGLGEMDALWDLYKKKEDGDFT